MKGAGDELIDAQMFVSKHTAKLKMRWKRGKVRLRREKYFVGSGGESLENIPSKGRCIIQQLLSIMPFVTVSEYIFCRGQRQHLCG